MSSFLIDCAYIPQGRRWKLPGLLDGDSKVPDVPSTMTYWPKQSRGQPRENKLYLLLGKCDIDSLIDQTLLKLP